MKLIDNLIIFLIDISIIIEILIMIKNSIITKIFETIKNIAGNFEYKKDFD